VSRIDRKAVDADLLAEAALLIGQLSAVTRLAKRLQLAVPKLMFIVVVAANVVDDRRRRRHAARFAHSTKRMFVQLQRPYVFPTRSAIGPRETRVDAPGLCRAIARREIRSPASSAARVPQTAMPPHHRAS